MAKQVMKSGFVIKLSSETAQKLAEEDVNRKSAPEIPALKTEEPVEIKEQPAVPPDVKQVREVCDLDSDDEEMESGHSVKTKNPTSSAQSESIDGNNWGDYASYVTYEGDTAIYTDPTTQQKYTWSKANNSWMCKDADGNEKDASGRVYSYEDDVHVYTDVDGSKSFWDEEKKAWIPKVDDDFLAYYHMSYGFVDNTEANVNEKDSETKEKVTEKKSEPPGLKRKVEPQWFDATDENNTKVYVSNLPLELTEEEFVDFMQKCGLVMRDPSNQKMKIKFYMDKEHNCFKGDALCTYIKKESVELALSLLDGSNFKDNIVKVERAHFQLKGEYNPALKPKKKKKKELEKIKKMQEKLFDWRPEKFVGERGKHEKVVIVKNLFRPVDFDKEVQLILDFQQDLREECGKCGEVRKVIIYDRHPEGVAQVTMKEPEQADEVVKLINNRWFGKRKLTAEIWDGKTKYKIAETDSEINQRIEKWDKFLEEDDPGKKQEMDGREKKGKNTEERSKPEVEKKPEVVKKTEMPNKLGPGPKSGVTSKSGIEKKTKMESNQNTEQDKTEVKDGFKIPQMISKVIKKVGINKKK